MFMYGIFTFTMKNQLDVGRYTSPMDPLGKSLQVALPFWPTVLNQVHLHRLWQSYDNRVSRQKGAFWYQVIGWPHSVSWSSILKKYLCQN